MIRINIHDAKTHLSRYLAALQPGETIVICRRNQPIAEIHPVQPRSTQPRPVGLAKGQFIVPSTFFDPLPEELEQAFEGEAR